MSVDVEQRIRDRAYTIWLEQGCPHGQDGDHWLQAERDVGVEAAPVVGPAPPAIEAAAPAVKAARKPAKKAAEPEAVAPAVPEASAKARKPRARKTVPA